MNTPNTTQQKQVGDYVRDAELVIAGGRIRGVVIFVIPNQNYMVVVRDTHGHSDYEADTVYQFTGEVIQPGHPEYDQNFADEIHALITQQSRNWLAGK